ncbi:MAG TPA: cytochrome b/b6 domain-containing protein [Burkholderiaceae bacterium]
MNKIYINPLPVRIWHWANAVGFVLLIATGLQIRYAGQVDLMPFKTAVNLHNWIGFVLIGNFSIWLLFYLFTDKIRVYHPELSPTKYFSDSFRQLRFYGYGIFRGDPNPHHASAYHKFNPLQSMMYQIIMILLVPIQFFTGVLLWDIARFSGMVDSLGGVRVVDTIHVLLFIFFCGFIIVHVYLASLGHTPGAHFKAMLTGYEEVDDEPGKAASA